jgi:hypothetical protein
MTVIHSQNVLLQDIYVNSTTHDGYPARNTDGADTIYSDHITFNRWTVSNGDDSISIKANSTNIVITNSVFYKGLGVAIGSIGQYKDVFETIENVYANNITCYNTAYAAYIKTWTGQQVGYPPNGGGGGLGCKSPLSFLSESTCEAMLMMNLPKMLKTSLSPILPCTTQLQQELSISRNAQPSRAWQVIATLHSLISGIYILAISLAMWGRVTLLLCNVVLILLVRILRLRT